MPAPGPNFAPRYGEDFEATFDLTIARAVLPPSSLDDLWMAVGYLGANQETVSTVLLRRRLADGEVTIVDDEAGRVKFTVPAAELTAGGTLGSPKLYFYDLWVQIDGETKALTAPAKFQVVPGVGP